MFISLNSHDCSLIVITVVLLVMTIVLIVMTIVLKGHSTKYIYIYIEVQTRHCTYVWLFGKFEKIILFQRLLVE